MDRRRNEQSRAGPSPEVERSCGCGNLAGWRKCPTIRRDRGRSSQHLSHCVSGSRSLPPRRGRRRVVSAASSASVRCTASVPRSAGLGVSPAQLEHRRSLGHARGAEVARRNQGVLPAGAEAGSRLPARRSCQSRYLHHRLALRPGARRGLPSAWVAGSARTMPALPKIVSCFVISLLFLYAAAANDVTSTIRSAISCRISSSWTIAAVATP